MSLRVKNSENCARVSGCSSTDLAQPWPAPSVSPKLNPPQAARPDNDQLASGSELLMLPLKAANETRPERMSVIWTSTAEKPAASNANAISA